jgi:hypothetical protein
MLGLTTVTVSRQVKKGLKALKSSLERVAWKLNQIFYDKIRG